MNRLSREVVGLVVQVGCLALSVYLVVSEASIPGASTMARVGLGILALVVAVTYGEISKQRAHLQAVLAALQSQASAGVARDDRKAVDTLIAALSSSDASKREIAHRHLMRLTGKDFPPEADRWASWWRDARDGFPPGGVGS